MSDKCLIIVNNKEVDAWVKEQMRDPDAFLVPIRGNPPEGATYSDGTRIVRPVNVAWSNPDTGARIDIVYRLGVDDQVG